MVLFPEHINNLAHNTSIIGNWKWLVAYVEIELNMVKVDNKEEKTLKDFSPLEYISRERENARAKIVKAIAKDQSSSSSECVNYDMEYNIRAIRAILATNDEIWDRCKGYRLGREGDETSFFKADYSRVRATTMAGHVEFMAEKERMVKFFNTEVLFQLPRKLNIYHGLRQLDDGSEFINFRSVLSKSYILSDQVLAPFLFKLKSHMESVQVCLGRIESWLMTPTETEHFLETTFDKKNLFSENDPEESPETICSNCHQKMRHHMLPSLLCASKKRKTSHRRSHFASNTLIELELLKRKISMGTINMTFKIAGDHESETDRTRLKKALELISM